MNFGLELRPVLLDESIQFGLSLPDHFKHNDGISKRILFDTLKKGFSESPVSKKSGFDIPFRTFLIILSSTYCLYGQLTPRASFLLQNFLKSIENDQSVPFPY